MQQRLPRRTVGAPVQPPAAALVKGGRARKRWRYAAVFGDDLLLCAASVRIGPAPQWFWALWDRRRGVLAHGTQFVPGAVALADGALRIRAGRRARVDLVLACAGAPVAVTSAHGASWIWTAKTPVRARGTVLVGGRAVDVDAPGLVDDSVGFHARRTSWCWSAGAATTADGRAVWWNLVDGLHDAPAGSERTVWVDGVAKEVGPVRFDADLARVRGDDGTDLRFAAEAQRARRDDLLVVSSRYRQPFGRFAGTLTGGIVVRDGRGVMERHDARW